MIIHLSFLTYVHTIILGKASVKDIPSELPQNSKDSSKRTFGETGGIESQQEDLPKNPLSPVVEVDNNEEVKKVDEALEIVIV